MKIERITLHHLRTELRHPFETSFGSISTRDGILIQAFANGLVGLGECAADKDPLYSYENTSTAWSILSDYLIPAVLGQELGDYLQYQSLVSFVRGHNMAKAGLEMALWDLWAKAEQLSLAALFGGDRSKVDVGVSIGIQPTPEDLLSTAQSYLDHGYRRIKIKIKPGREVKETTLLRSSFPDLKLQVDANSAYTLENAALLDPLDHLELLLIEQPLAEDDIWDHRTLQARFKTPICLDESITSPRFARQALEMEACRVINIKPGRVGGLGYAREIHDHCLARGIPVWCGGMLETNVGRASNLAIASLPGFSLPGDISASDRYYVLDITQQSFSLNPDSTIDVPDGPGLGVDL
ncbi:MAG: o-succinylbenzoate synthase, partial [Anaerolineae bacterium]|nr:o-succinylbenzoate synthase [Anaerolineae bacterium]